MESANIDKVLWLLLLLCGCASVNAEGTCYGAGSITTSVVVSILVTLVIIGAIFLWIRKRRYSEHLILETDSEKGAAEYSFDNPGFKESGLSPLSKSLVKPTSKLDSEQPGKQKLNYWPALSAVTTKSDKRTVLDDSVLENNEIKVVALRSHDFTGLGFNICGNMKDGIYIKDILHRGPAIESGILKPGDRINSVTINFEHIVYEDALNILSYASPYEVIIEAKSDKIQTSISSENDHPRHPIYRSSSSTDLQKVQNSARKILHSENSSSSDQSTLQKTMSNITMLEKRDSTSANFKQVPSVSSKNNSLLSEELRHQLEKKISPMENETRLKREQPRLEKDTQETENKHQKFGVKVFPMGQPKILSRSENNINIEENNAYNIVDRTKSENDESIGRDEKCSESFQQEFDRSDILYGSGLKRDSLGIPQEIPTHMLNAAVAARRNRKSLDEIVIGDEEVKTIKKVKAKAPRPPAEDKYKEPLESMSNAIPTIDSYEIEPVGEQLTESSVTTIMPRNISTLQENSLLKEDSVKKYNSVLDNESRDQPSANTIELNSSHITIHHEVSDEERNRKTASTGDLSTMNKNRESTSGTLERAQSLDITDSGITTFNNKRQAMSIQDTVGSKSEENVGDVVFNKESRLSLILDGLNTFQRNRLKKSTEWGNLEDAILKSNQEDDRLSNVLNQNISLENFAVNFGEKSAELDALVTKIDEIRRESIEVESAQDFVLSNETVNTHKNQLWPTNIQKTFEIIPTPPNKSRSLITANSPISLKPKANIRNEIWPKELEHNKNNELFSQVETTTRTSEHKTREEFDQDNIKLESIINSVKLQSTECDEDNNKINQTTKFPENSSETRSRENIQINTVSSSQIEEMNNQKFDIINEPATKTPQSGDATDSGSYADAIIGISEKKGTPQSSFKDLNDKMQKPQNYGKKMHSNLEAIEIICNNITPSTDNNNIHKRQRIPSNENGFLLPPNMERSNLEIESTKSQPQGSENKTENENYDMPILETSTVRNKSPNAISYETEQSYTPLTTNSEKVEIFREINHTDESKTSNWKDGKPRFLNDTKSFILNERHICGSDVPYQTSHEDINISDDIKVSRHSVDSSEIQKSDDVKSIESLKYSSNITVNSIQTENSLHSLEFSVNESSEGVNLSELSDNSELYTTASNKTAKSDEDISKITINTPDLIKNVTITEAINKLNSDINQNSDLNFEFENGQHKFCSPSENGFLHSHNNGSSRLSSDNSLSTLENASKSQANLTYVTEIQVTPNSGNANISDIEILPSVTMKSKQYPKYSENDFEDYLKGFEMTADKENKGLEVENEKQEYNDNIIVTNIIDPEKELHKIQEIVQEQLKKLPEMKFSTSSYENTSRKPEKKQSQIELLKSNFEKSPNKPSKTDTLSKSRIPVSTLKTPPTSPERRDSKNLDIDNDKEILELMSATIHSTPMTNSLKYQKSPNKNISITSIRNSSKIPTGLPILGGSRPPVSLRKPEQENISVAESSTNNTSFDSFKQWVFDPMDSVTNITLSDQKP